MATSEASDGYLDQVTSRVYHAGAMMRSQFRAILDACGMTAKAAGEPFEWSERKAWLESHFSVRAARRRHEQIKGYMESLVS